MSVTGGVEPRRGGENAESQIIQRWEALRYVPDSEAVHFDAVTESLLEPSSELPFVGICLVEAGTSVEIKSTMVALNGGRRGRFLFRREQHEALLEAAGMYVLAVCEPHIGRDLIATKLVPASLMDEELGEWVEVDGGADYCQLAWSRAFADQEVGP